VPWPQSLSYKNQNESLKAGFFSSCFRLRSIDGVGGFLFVFRTERGGQKPKADSLKNPGFLDFFHFAIFLLVLVYWILHDGKIIFSPKKSFSKQV